MEQSGKNRYQSDLREIIKNKIYANNYPYVKTFKIQKHELPDITDNQVHNICNSVMKELGFRFNIEFQPEFCVLKARKIPIADRFLEQYNYARADAM